MAARTKRADPGLYVATTTGVVRIKGVVYRYIRGKTIVSHTDPLIKTLPGSFQPLEMSGPEVVTL